MGKLLDKNLEFFLSLSNSDRRCLKNSETGRCKSQRRVLRIDLRLNERRVFGYLGRSRGDLDFEVSPTIDG